MEKDNDGLQELRDEQYLEIALLQHKYQEGIVNKEEFYTRLSEITDRIRSLMKKIVIPCNDKSFSV